MRLKDGLVLRKVADQYIIVPTGKRVKEIPNMVYIPPPRFCGII